MASSVTRVTLIGRMGRSQRSINKTLNNVKAIVQGADPPTAELESSCREAEAILGILRDKLLEYHSIMQQVIEAPGDPGSTATAVEIDTQNDEISEFHDEALLWQHRLTVSVSRFNEKLAQGRLSGPSTSPITPITPTWANNPFSNLESQLGQLLERQMDPNSPNRASTEPSGTMRGRNHTIKLPKLELRKYGGDKLRWTEFWDSFEASVDKNESLQPIERMNYLLAQLEGEARGAISGLDISNENYTVATTLLKERFGNPQTLITSIHTKLMNITAPSNDTKKLREFYDALECSFRSLQALGQSIDMQDFVALITAKLPQEILLALERGKIPNQEWTTDVLRQRLNNEITAREAVERCKPKGNTEGKSTVSRKALDNKEDSSDKKHYVANEALVGDGSVKCANRAEMKCIYCNGHHWSDECRKYKTMKARKGLLGSRCYICLGTSHRVKECRSNRKCVHCGEEAKHHRSICPIMFGTRKSEAAAVSAEQEKDNGKQVSGSSKPNSKEPEEGLLGSGEKVLLQTALTKLSPIGSNIKCEVKALFDCGCNRSYITESLAKSLHLKTIKGDTISLNRFASGKAIDIVTKSANIQIQLIDRKTMPLTVNVIPQITGPLHRAELQREESKKLLQNFPLADEFPNGNESRTVELLIGNDYYLDLITGEKMELRNGLYLLGSRLGWILTGRTPTQDNQEYNEQSLLAIGQRKHSLVMDEPMLFTTTNMENARNTSDFWDLETIGMDDKDLPNNYQLAYKRFSVLTRKFCQDSDLLAKYNAIIEDQEKKGAIEKVKETTTDVTRIHYIPHYAVQTPLKATTKVRIIYDASAKPTKAHHSLNDCMYRGPLFLADLCGLLMRFRMHPIAIISDIEKAFLQVSPQEQERDVTRFMWYKDPKCPTLRDNMQIYRFCRVPFGVISSPFLLGATIDHHMRKINTTAAEKVRNNVYGDNVIL